MHITRKKQDLKDNSIFPSQGQREGEFYRQNEVVRRQNFWTKREYRQIDRVRTIQENLLTSIKKARSVMKSPSESSQVHLTIQPKQLVSSMGTKPQDLDSRSEILQGKK